MTQIYNKYSVYTNNEIVQANLQLLGIENYEEQHDKLIIYIDENLENDNKNLEQYLQSEQINFEIEKIENTNWNSLWESNYEPITIHNELLIKAHFHNTTENFKYVIEINPSMSFGTGHHATTYLMCQQLLKLGNLKNKSLIDYGTGTGILAILAEKLGAKQILANDNDSICVDNALSNASINNCTNIKIQQLDCTKNELPKQIFDIILANINLNILQLLIPRLTHHTKENTILILSGVLVEDLPELKIILSTNNWKFIEHTEKDGWISAKAQIIVD